MEGSDDDAIVREATPEVELGPPLELSAPFVPRPATESLWLIRVRRRHTAWLLCRACSQRDVFLVDSWARLALHLHRKL